MQHDFQVIVCDRCGETSELPPEQRYARMQVYRGSAFEFSLDLCETCFNSFVRHASLSKTRRFEWLRVRCRNS